MSLTSMDRRHLLKVGGALSVLGAGAPFALQLAAAGAAAGATPPDYKALVCIFMFGGNDGNNTVLATDADSWGRYQSARNTGQDPIALMPVGTAPTPVGQVSPVTGRVATLTSPEAWGGVVPIAPANPQLIPPGTNATTRTFALHPFLAPLKPVFNAGRLAVVANLGTLVAPITKTQYQQKTVAVPVNLFSHNDQQSIWQAGAGEGAQLGWGGRMADLLASMNGANTIFTAISPAGNAVFLSGQSVIQYVVTTSAQPALVIGGAAGSSLFTSAIAPADLKALVQDNTATSDFAADYGSVVTRSITASALVNSAFNQSVVTAVPAPATFINPLTGAAQTNPLAVQMQTVARMIAAAPILGVRRQVFFVSMGGFDTHANQNTTQPALLAQLAHALAYFDGVITNIGGADLSNTVTTFTASDFSRTFTTNGTGTDHAWGSHHFVMGGAVKGKNIFGQYPTLGVDLGSFTNPNMVGNALIPTSSVDQYGATVGAWFGVGASDLASIFPNLGNYATSNLGFV